MKAAIVKQVAAIGIHTAISVQNSLGKRHVRQLHRKLFYQCPFSRIPDMFESGALWLQETAARAEQTADSPSKVATEAAAVGAHEALLAQNGVGELYVRLLCQFEPDMVLPFLQSHDAYRVEEVLPYTERFGVADAQVQGHRLLSSTF